MVYLVYVVYMLFSSNGMMSIFPFCTVLIINTYSSSQEKIRKEKEALFINSFVPYFVDILYLSFLVDINQHQKEYKVMIIMILVQQ